MPCQRKSLVLLWKEDGEDTTNTDLGSLSGGLSQTLLLSFTPSNIGPAFSTIWRLRGDGLDVYQQGWLHVFFSWKTSYRFNGAFLKTQWITPGLGPQLREPK